MTIDWSTIQLAVFDVDGTLYNQRALRSKMLLALMVASVRRLSLLDVRVVAFYRRHREELGEAEVEGFEPLLLARTAERFGIPVERVRAICHEWLEQRPLPLLLRARYAHLDRLFAALRANGVQIGILSDYPATEKLAALGLPADHIVWAGEPAVNVLKPNARGLQLLIARAGVSAAETVMIGDRDERDGEIARRLGVRALIRSSKPILGVDCFDAYDSGPFADLLAKG